jgi:hypothetical protein
VEREWAPASLFLLWGGRGKQGGERERGRPTVLIPANYARPAPAM